MSLDAFQIQYDAEQAVRFRAAAAGSTLRGRDEVEHALDLLRRPWVLGKRQGGDDA